MKLSMQQAKEIAKKKYKEDSSSYWKYVSKLLDEDFNPPMMQPAQTQQKTPDLQSQLKTSLVNQGATNPDKIAGEALDLATQRAPTDISKSDPSYWPTVMQNAEQMAGVKADIQTAGNPVSGQTNQQPNSVTSQNSMFSANESYISFKDSSTDLPVAKGKLNEVVISKAITDIVKDLKKTGRTENEIIYTLINRYRVNQLDAYDAVYGEKKKQADALPSDPMDIKKNLPQKIKVNEDLSIEEAWNRWNVEGDKVIVKKKSKRI